MEKFNLGGHVTPQNWSTPFLVSKLLSLAKFGITCASFGCQYWFGGLILVAKIGLEAGLHPKVRKVWEIYLKGREFKSLH